MVTQLIGADELFDTATAAFPRGLGKQATAAWVALGHNSEIKQFDSGVQLAVRTGLNRAPPPYRTNLEANAAVFRGEIAKVNDLTALVVGASADLRTTAAAQQTSTTDRLIIELVLLGLLTVAVFAVAVWLAGLVNGPLARIADAADAVRQGNLDVAPLDATGPRELAYAAGAFNEMTATLRAVESHAVALAGRDLGDPVLREPLPGRTGRALQGALDRLQDSVREADHRRAELHDLATHDSLTGLLNRGAAIEAVERDLARSGRDGSSVALLFIDLDGLKAINDTYGHEGGDAALRATGEAITSSTRLGDIRGRLGGDEFIVAHLHSGRHADVATLAERIRRCVAETELDVQGQIVRIHCSIGIAQSGAEDATAEALIARADSALYGAKQQGRNRVAWYVPLALDPA
jgi:diguanylate cyclase (GGDEF)-like protein